MPNISILIILALFLTSLSNPAPSLAVLAPTEGENTLRPHSASSEQTTSRAGTPQWIVGVRPWAELAYFISTILLLLVAVYGAKQIGFLQAQISMLREQIILLKHDVNTRNLRAAKEQALAYCDRFSRYVLLRRKFVRKAEHAKLTLFSGATNADFTDEALDANAERIVDEKLKLDECIATLNELELIAMAFISGVADEGEGFNTIGHGFCATVATHYDIIAIQGRRRSSFKNIRALYKIWSSRSQLAEIEKERHRLEVRAKATPNHKISPLGLEGSLAAH
jgi:hypothetical protein